MNDMLFEYSCRIARGIAAQFGPECEVVVHDLRERDVEHSIVAIENGEISGRKIGDGPSRIVLKAMQEDPAKVEDRLAYLTKTSDGKVLKSSTIFIRDEENRIIGILGINYDISMLIAFQKNIQEFTLQNERPETESSSIPLNVNDLLDDLIRQSIALIGKPAALMTKEEKVRAVGFLKNSGALLITKSGPKICKAFGISSYTLYSSLDECSNDEKAAD